ncbi:PspA/IM30 family protein [uncultured Muribaculum sp.]|uniref:PspA/IM30 family protein n=1 Tax=uncultured Muribaculum sp. TaxID=1918613 RepID=UPI00272FAEA0|nr:hypothetical protein [uncultured Muribaculum sp.]
MSQESDIYPEDFLKNIADELTTISGECTEIKQAQLTAATTDDLNNMGTSIASAVVEKVSSMQSAIDSQSRTVSAIGDNMTNSVKSLTDTDTEKIDNFTANPPVQKVEKTIRIARESWQWYLTLGFTVFSTLLFFAMTFWQEGRIERCQVSDIKYHYILMHNGVNSVGLDSIESRFRDPDKVKIIESEVRDYEERVQETARAIEQKHRLEQKINELNTQSQYSKK